MSEGAGPAGFREIDHTADLGFEVWAPNLATLFELATTALAELIYDREQVRPLERRRVEVRADGVEELLVRWLQEVYLLVESEQWLTASVRSLEVGEDSVRGEVEGEGFDPARHQIHTEIKAITYHRLEVRHEGGQVRTQVIVDV